MLSIDIDPDHTEANMEQKILASGAQLWQGDARYN